MVTQSRTVKRMQLSDSALSRIGFSREGRLVFHDAQVVGFQLVVGTRSKVFRVRLRGTYKSLGHWPVMRADEARRLALEVLRQHAASRHEAMPVVAKPVRMMSTAERGAPGPTVGSSITKVRRRPGPLLKDVLVAYFETRALKPRTAADYREILARYAADWLEQPITAITSDDFEERFRKVSIKSKAQANYLARVLSAQWTFGAAKFGYSGANPTERLKVLGGFHKIKPRDGIIPDRLQPKWWKGVELLEDRHVSAALIFIMLTGCRKGEALGLQTGDIDWHSRTVIFPDTKNGTSHRLPLGHRLHALLLAHCKSLPVGPVFRVNTQKIHAATEKVGDAIGLKWTAHDLRRTFITTAQRTLGDLATVKRLVNHSLGGDVTTKHYLRLNVEDLRQPMQQVEDAFHDLRAAQVAD